MRRNKQFAIEVGRAILDDPNMSVVRVEKDIFNNAWKLFSRNKKQIWSFTDSTSYVLIQKLKIVEAVSFDKHFQEFGIKLLA